MNSSFLGGVGVAVGGCFLAHRHGRLRGIVESGKKEIDAQVKGARPGVITPKI